MRPDPATLELARLPLRVFGIVVGIEAVGLPLMFALLGAGDMKRVMVVAIVSQWVFFLPLAFVIGPFLGFGLLGVPT